MSFIIAYICSDHKQFSPFAAQRNKQVSNAISERILGSGVQKKEFTCNTTPTVFLFGISK